MRDFQGVSTDQEVDLLVKELLEGPDLFAFDVETGYTSAEPAVRRSVETRHPDFVVVGFSVTNDPSWARYIPLRHAGESNLDPLRTWEAFRPVLENKQMIAHNASFERAALNSLARAGDARSPIVPKHVGHDTMLLANSLGKYKEVGLKFLTAEVLGEEQKSFASLFGESVLDKNGKISAAKMKRTRLNQLPVSPEVISYGCDDSALCFELFNEFYPQLTEAQRRSYMVEMQIMVLMSQAEEFGVAVDWTGMEQALSQYKNFKPKFEKKVREEFAEMTVDPAIKELARSANFASPVQMRRLLYDGLNMKTTRTTKTGAQSTDAQALEALSRKHPAVRSLLSLREIDNLGRRLKKWLDEYSGYYDGRVHPSFSQTVAITGRFAASSPAIQQLPKTWLWSLKTDSDGALSTEGLNGEDYWGGNFREFVIAGEGNKLLTFDYSQQEVRVLAGITQEPTFLRAFETNTDPHLATAAMMFGKPIEHVTKEERQKGKAQPLDAKILTPHGWTTMGELRVGDFVIGSKGTPVKVTGVFPQGKRKVFEVHVGDGVVECCEEHLWSVHNQSTKTNNEFRPVTLHKIIKSGVRRTTDNTIKGKTYNQPKYQLPPRPVVEFAEQDNPLLIDPYVLGLLLGDGCFTHDGIMFASSQGELNSPVLDEADRLECKVSGHFSRSDVDGFYIWGDGSKKVGSNALREALKYYGLDKKKSNTKFIPKEYLLSSPANRLAVLQGLLDTDGTVASSGASFRVTSKQLAEGVREIALSLGGFASIKSVGVPKRYRTDSLFNSKLPVWEVYLTLPLGVNPFRLERKRLKTERKYQKNPTIRKVVETDTYKEMQCISVDAEDCLYITDDYVLTHNTINFSLLYGQGAKSMGERLAISTEEAEDLIAQYKSRLAKVGAWDARSRIRGIRDKKVTTWFGREVPLWNADSPDSYTRSHAERLAVNAQIQGGAADYTKLAMLRSWQILQKHGLWGPDKVMLTMNQHDSLTFEFNESLDVNFIRSLLQEAVVFDAQKMFPKLNVPKFPVFDVDWEMGKAWGSSVGWPLDVEAVKEKESWVIPDKPEAREEVVAWDKSQRQDDIPSVTSVSFGERVLHAVATNPNAAGILKFKELVASRSGETRIHLTVGPKTVRLGSKTSLSLADSNLISMVLGGAKVYERSGEDMETIMNGSE